jgi:hypothetical protein
MRLLRRAAETLRTSFRSFLLVNFVYFGLVGCGMTYGAWNPESHKRVLEATRSGAKEGMPAVFSAYSEGRFARAIAMTFLINLLAGAFVFITFPSFIMPFAGMAMGTIRAVMWGLIFTPHLTGVNAAALALGGLIAVLLLLEGTGYTLAMHGSYLHGRAVLQPASVNATTRWQGYKIGARQMLALYPLIAVVLATAAVYEAVLGIYLKPLLI